MRGRRVARRPVRHRAPARARRYEPVRGRAHRPDRPGPGLPLRFAGAVVVLGGLLTSGLVLVGLGASAGSARSVIAGLLLMAVLGTVERILIRLTDVLRPVTVTGGPVIAAMAGGTGVPWHPAHPWRTGGGPAPHDHRPSPTFWGALGDAERDALLAVGVHRTFAAGSVLFREGEEADHVVVILGGRTRISVHEAGRERVLAERGPGQLLGERAALQVSVRSASVVALETVRALVLSTEAFAEFVGAHPYVLEIVEGQVYDRLTEPGTPFSPSARPSGYGDVQARRAVARPVFDGENCTILFTDVAGFGAHVRNDDDRGFVRASLFEMLQDAFADPRLGGLDRNHWEDRGDGFLIIVPPNVPTRTVVESLPHRLAAALRRHNRRAGEPVRIQLRLAVHVGPVKTDQVGVTGSAIIHTARILEAEDLKNAMAGSGAGLGVVASSFVFDNIIRHSDEARRIGRYEEIRCQVKESVLTAWMSLADDRGDPA